jgi:hypothetical protein
MAGASLQTAVQREIAAPPHTSMHYWCQVRFT